MKFSDIFSVFVPQNKSFYQLFSQSSANLVEISKAFVELTNAPVESRPGLYKRISDLEHVGDEITHRIFTELSINFITPFDREDISYLASSLDDIADFIHGSTKKIEVYKIESFTPAMFKLAELIEHSTREIHTAVSHLKDTGNQVRVREAIIRINSIENHADDVYESAIAHLFEYETDAIKVIKMQEILSNLETATDKCEDVANVIETILVKNS